MNWNAAFTIVVSVLLALAGYGATYLNNLRLDRRKDRLDRVDRQLRDLYGPLLALASAGDAAWQAFRSINRPGGTPYWHDLELPTPAEVAAWRLWIREVFMPVNEQIVDAVTQHADLLIESEMPQCLLDVCAHVAAYRPIIKEWQGDRLTDAVAANTSVINFPSEALRDYASSSFTKLKAEQNSLLGKSRAGNE